MKEVILYPPNGGEGVTPHPSKIEEMKGYGWTDKGEAVAKKSKSTEKTNGES
jgi:hypothetical protein